MARSRLHEFFYELKRRRVFRVAVVYAAVSWALIQIASTVSEPLDLPSWFVKFVIIGVAFGLPIALGLAWAFDVKPDRGDDASPAAPGRTSSWSFALVALLLAVTGVAAVMLRQSEDAAAAGENAAGEEITSIAVLPFANFTSDQENEHFGDGLTEELLNSLAQIQGLRVAARTSSFSFKGSNADVREIADRLNVQTVLEGSVRRIGNRVRVTAQLIDASDGHHLWSKTYEREVNDIFAIQDELSAAIVQSLSPRFAAAGGHAADHGTHDFEAYDLYLRGRHQFWQGGGEAGLRAAADLFEQAVRADSTFSHAYAALSDAYMLLGSQVPPREVMPKAKAAALRALELNSRLAEGYVALASINWLYDWDWRAADQNYRISFSVNPLLHTRCICYAWYLAAVGNTKAAVVEAERARDMDPIARLPRVISAWMYYLDGRPADARAEINEIFTTAPNDVSARRISAWLLWDEGKRDEAIDELHRIRDDVERNGSFAERGPPIVMAELALMYGQHGWNEAAREMRDHLRARAGRGYVPPEYVAAAEAAAGDSDRAFAAMRHAVENRSNLGQFSILPLSRQLRADARYREILHAIGLAPST